MRGGGLVSLAASSPRSPLPSLASLRSLLTVLGLPADSPVLTSTLTSTPPFQFDSSTSAAWPCSGARVPSDSFHTATVAPTGYLSAFGTVSMGTEGLGASGSAATFSGRNFIFMPSASLTK